MADSIILGNGNLPNNTEPKSQTRLFETTNNMRKFYPPGSDETIRSPHYLTNFNRIFRIFSGSGGILTVFPS
jgi:hypothetical protein